MVLQPPDRERAHAVGVAHAKELRRRQQHEAIGSFELRHNILQLLHVVFARRGGEQARDELGVTGAQQLLAAPQHLCTQCQRVGEVAVVRHRQRTECAFHEHRLGVLDAAGAGGGVAGVADGGESVATRRGRPR